ncbi:MAG: cysteine--tRNA ligase [Deltaproteobacteria bacterium]|nr:cysteine--tRNA ligase [Deltaproteobacteria bacterium]
MAASFRIYNTLSRSVEDFVPQVPGKVGIYVCGMTVYDRSHVGHARAMVVFDAFVRYLRHRSWDVLFVRNFTDVDDKIIRRANELGEDPVGLASRFIDVFHEDMDALGLVRPDHEPRVSRCIDDIHDVIGKLVDKGHAYVSEGTVWYAVRTFDEYGKLSGQNIDELRSPDEAGGKRDPADFALWKCARPGEVSWESPWGPGRPGWHIECSAMGCKHLGATLDIHGGGLDLVFPHHENEIAQSEAANGAQFANYWMHNGLLTMAGGQKMGKSLGNVINIDVALAEFPAEALRLYYLQNKYRSPLPWSGDALPEALGMLSRLYDAREAAEAMGGEGDADRIAKEMGKTASDVLRLGRDFEARFHGALDEDFNTGGAIGAAFELARAVNRFADHKKARKRGGPIVAPALGAFALLADGLGLLGRPVSEFHAEVKVKRLKALGLDEAAVEGMLAERSAARAAKDWARSDALRDELEGSGIIVMDKPEGVQWRVRCVAPDSATA